jgi:CRP-like cAMP-binding protein
MQGETSVSENSAIKNRLLSNLPAAELERLNSHLERIPLPFKKVLYAPDEPIEYVYFMESGVASLLAIVDNEDYVEVGTVGDEGMIGIPVFLGAETTPVKAIVQIPGEGIRIPSNQFRLEVSKNGIFTYLLNRFLQAMFVMLAQNTACNRGHNLEQRAARWLLITQDRTHTDEFPLTQEFLAQMLGVRRASVSQVQQKLKEAGLIFYSRGNVTVLDREGLEKVACQCYDIIKSEFDRMYSNST